MKTYKYTARDSSGSKKEGRKQANSSNDVVTFLRGQGYIPINVEELNQSAPRKVKARAKRIKSADLSTFCWQLSTMLEGGINITTALDTIAEDMDNSFFRNIISSTAENIRNGESFVMAVSHYPNVFNHLSRAIMMAGESGGNLELAMKRLALYYENKDKMAKQLRAAMAYPVFVFSFIVLILVGIMTLIVPRFKEIFDQIGGELPTFTQAFMSFYDFTAQYFIYMIAVFVATIVFTTAFYTKTATGHLFFSKLSLRIPLLGKIFSHAFVSTFCKTSSTMLSAGVSVLEVFDVLSHMTKNDVIKNAICKTKDNIIEGKSVSASMMTTDFFPNMVIKMTQVGEESGTMTTVLDKTADYYERKVEATIATVITLIEPIMIGTIGSVVLVVVIALYLPVFTMSDISG